MFIDQTKAIEKYSKHMTLNSGILPKSHQSITTDSVLDYKKTQAQMQGYRVTKGNHYFMQDAFYQKPNQNEEQTVLEQLDTQMDMSSKNRRNQMIVAVNTLSEDDLKEMQKNGFSALDMDSHTVITVTDKIKATLAQAGVDISGYGDSLSMKELKEITGSTAVASQVSDMLQKAKLEDTTNSIDEDLVSQIKEALKNADLPITKANVQESAIAYQTAISLEPLGDAGKKYLIKNGYEPTVQNLYKAQYCATEYSIKNTNIDFKALEKQIEQMIRNAGLEVNSETKTSCEWLIQEGIALTTDNLIYIQGLNTLSQNLLQLKTQELENSFVLHRIAEAITDGKRPMDALLVKGFSFMDKAKMAMDTITNATEEDLAYCVSHEMNLTIENLNTAQGNRTETAVGVSVEISMDISYISAKRQLEETRLAMTLEANYSLVKRGIPIDTKPLEQLVEDLRNQENQYYKNLMTQSGVEATEENIALFSKTTTYVEELKFQPAYALQLGGESAITIRSLHETGSALKSTMDRAMQSYETMWTAPRSDLGDSITKAFQNIDAILSDLGLELTESNQRAVRILAYNKTELTVENIQHIKETDMEVQRLFRNLNPATTLEMIRRGENPLDMELSELNHLVEEIQAETGEQETERFSKYLWKLEKNHEITQQERDSYMGIYRLITQVEKTDGAVIGALMNQGADITMRNLLTAVRSGKKTINYEVNDDFAGVRRTVIGKRIDDQIMSSYYLNCVKESADIMSPEALKETPNWEEMTPERFLEAMKQNAHEENAVVAEQEYQSETLSQYTSVLEASDDVYAFLEKYDIKNSAKNVLAISKLLENPSNVFDVLFAEEGKSLDYKKMIQDMKDKVLKNFGEAVKTPEEMVKAQATLAEVAENVMKTMIVEQETISVKDLQDLRLMNQQLYLCKERAREESYLVPVTTGDSVTGVSLKIVRGKADKGLVDIFFRGALMAKVAASFEAKEKGITGVIATTDEQTRQMLSEKLDGLREKMQEDGQEEVDIRITQVTDLSMWQFEKKTLPETGEANPVQTKRLYHIAESFIQMIGELSEV